MSNILRKNQKGDLPKLELGCIEINDSLYVEIGKERWTYFHNLLPIAMHSVDDVDYFRLLIAQLVESGACRVCELQKSLKLNKNRILRAKEKLTSEGPGSFFSTRNNKRSGTVLDDVNCKKASEMFEKGMTRREVATELDVYYDTLNKAIKYGRVVGPQKKTV